MNKKIIKVLYIGTESWLKINRVYKKKVKYLQPKRMKIETWHIQLVDLIHL